MKRLMIVVGCLMGVGVEGASLWMKGTTNEKGLFMDKVASRIGDIVSVKISLGATLTSEKKSDTVHKDGTISNTLTNLFYSNSNFLKRRGELPGTNVTGSNDFNSKGKVTNTMTMKDMEMSARVVDVLPNGNLVLEGVRQTGFGGDRDFVILSGIVPGYAIRPGNQVESKYIADFKLEVIGEGMLSTRQREGWLMQVNNMVSPF